MARKKSAPKPEKAKAKPADAGHDAARAIRKILKSQGPLTLNQIHSRHESAHGSADSVEDTVVNLVRENKLKLAPTTEKTVTLSRKEFERLVADRPADAPMTFSMTTVQPLIPDDDAQAAVLQWLRMKSPAPYTSVEALRELQRMGKTRYKQGAIDDAMESLYSQKKIVLIPNPDPNAEPRFYYA